MRRGTGNHAGRLYRALCRVPELHEIPDDAAGQCDDQRPEKNAPVKPLLERTGLKPEAVAQCSELMLSREFEGIDLSGGLWQQVAIARGQYREHDLIVLDEPTAAIDPVEESAVYEKFLQMVKGKTAVIVTHRLASARLADRILVMEKDGLRRQGRMRNCLRQADFTAGCGKHRRRITLFNRGGRYHEAVFLHAPYDISLRAGGVGGVSCGGNYVLSDLVSAADFAAERGGQLFTEQPWQWNLARRFVLGNLFSFSGVDSERKRTAAVWS